MPKADVSQLYYRRKLSAYNFTVFELVNRQGFCYMWHEGIAKRGACEIGSCLYSFIKLKVTEGTKEFSFYSDNCSGQNRNRYIFSLYMFCASKFGVKITHNFLETGHTQNEGDSMHSVIERAPKNQPVFTPCQWYSIARLACKKKSYIVKEVNCEDIYDLKKLLNHTTKNWERGTKNEKILWNKVRVVVVNPETPNIVSTQSEYDGEVVAVDTLERVRRKLCPLEEYTLTPMRNSQIPIPQAKYDDLMHLCKEKVIPDDYHSFYKGLQRSGNNANANNDSDD